jgi:CRISPR-associated protein Cas1
MLRGRLGLETARIPHADRHGLLHLGFGNLTVENGCLRFVTAGVGELPAGDYQIPFQGISLILLGPGTTISHDALRLCARHNTGLVAVGDGGVRMYTAPPLSPDQSQTARAQVRLWSDINGGRLLVARKMYALRFGEILPHGDIAVLRGIEGGRVKEAYRRIAQQYGLTWDGRRYDRQNPDSDTPQNQAINHAATAVEAAAMIAVAATGTIPALGFIHEDSGMSFTLDIADLVRTEVTVPIAFAAVKAQAATPDIPLERVVRRTANRVFRERKLIPTLIDHIHALLDVPAGSPPPRPAGA